jgi:hypothetical protein
MLCALLPAAPAAAPGDVPPGAAVSFSPPCPGSTTAGLPSWPPCIDVTFTGHDVTGLPPFTFTWEVSNGFRFYGNPGVLDTAALPPGFFSLRLLATNAYGTGQSQPVFFTIEALQTITAPSWENLGGLAVQFVAHTEGAVEYQWEWGDGTTSPWLPGCDGSQPVHTYPAAGTYTARLRARNCRDPVLLGAPFPVTVTEEAQLAILDWHAVCPFGFCIFDLGEAIAFVHSVQGSPTTYAYDWNGDGITDQLAEAPVPAHAYPQQGTFTPRLTVSRGTQVATFLHAVPIFIQPGTGALFADGFESGDLSAWSLVVGAAGKAAGERPRP